MQTIHVPKIGARYWAGITMASVFGTNTTGITIVAVLVLWKSHPREQRDAAKSSA